VEHVGCKACGQLAAGYHCGAAQGADCSFVGPAATAAVKRAGSWRVALPWSARAAGGWLLPLGRVGHRPQHWALAATVAVERSSS